MKKSYMAEFMHSICYSVLGSLGLSCVVQVCGMMLSRWEYPYRMPFFICVGFLALTGCILLLVNEFQTKKALPAGKVVAIRLATILLSFVPFLLCCAWIFGGIG